MENLKEFLSKKLEYLKQQDLKYPNRRKEIHKGCCKNCPSNNDAKNGVADPESEEIKNYPKELILKEFAFVCAWRPNKLCKGFCDFHGIDQQFIIESDYKFDIHRDDFYEYDKPRGRTLKRLAEIAECGMEIVMTAEFGYKGVMSGLYIEKVWSYSDEDFKDYMDWAKGLIATKTPTP